MQLSCSSPICLLSTTSGDAQAVKDAATLATAILLKILIIGTLSFIVPISTSSPKINWFKTYHQ